MMVVICIANSWYHSLGAYSYFLDTFEGDRSIDKIIYFSGGLLEHKANTLSARHFQRFCKEVEEVSGWDRLAESVNSISKSEVCLLISASSLPYKAVKLLVRNNLNFSMLLVEEGIGSYGGWVQSLKAKMRESRGGVNKLRSLGGHLVKKIYVSMKSLNNDKWLNFNSDASLNLRVIDAYRLALSEISKETKGEVSGYDSLIFTSPFVELGMQTEEEYFEALVEDGVSNFDLIKPHPIEDIEKYERRGFAVYKGDLSSELMIASSSSISDVFCFSSTSLYTSKIFFGLNVRRLKCGDMFYDSLSPLQRKILDTCSE